ncbi:MAG: peptidoglycan DD-metalloendopeptidase family protein [Ignavibacteriales bacterium]|nr:peptidoglycan DD-metalloendopeptidase family protein [Ignavibacteriales bacterium]
MRRTIYILLFLGIAQPLFAQEQGKERFVKIINRLVEAMNNQDYNGIVREYDKGMSAAFPLFKTTYFFKNNFDTFGKVIKVDPPEVRAVDQAFCVMYSERGAQDLTLYIDDQGKIKGFLFTTHVASEPQPNPSNTTEPNAAAVQTPISSSAKPAAPKSNSDSSAYSEAVKEVAPSSTPSPSPVKQPVAPVVRDKQQTQLYVPFTGTWAVIAGGELREGTSQSNLLQQQYAYEFSGTDAGGSRYKNDGKANEDYVGYGKDIIAPANGTVVEVIDGIRENSPGTRNPYAQIGNTIIIQHSGKEYSVLAFLKQGSIRVKVGDKVIRGQVLAKCGSSGNATEPVLHYHLQDSPYLQNAKGVKFYFEHAMVSKEGKKELQLIHLPVVGEVISPE